MNPYLSKGVFLAICKYLSKFCKPYFMPFNHTISVGIADDHHLVRKALINLINSFGDYCVVIEAGSGNELLNKLPTMTLPTMTCPGIILLDVIMKDGNGYETARKINGLYPSIKIIALSECTEPDCMVRMFKAGATGFVAKNMEPEDLRSALEKIVVNELYFPAGSGGFVLNGLLNAKPQNGLQINDRELKFLKYLSTDMTYKEIADEMFISPKTVDDYKSNLCSKLKVRSRSGLITYAIKHGLIEI
jgi:DNA-binding NarL/FixJ family response regulator